jgi:shikimate 5-dehydrogenase
MNGDVMLIHQSGAAFELWTGQPAPTEVIRAQLDTSRNEPEVPVEPVAEAGAAA